MEVTNAYLMMNSNVRNKLQIKVLFNVHYGSQDGASAHKQHQEFGYWDVVKAYEYYAT